MSASALSITLANVAALLFGPAALARGASPADETRGVVVERVGQHPAGQKDVLQEGDRLFSWVRRDEKGIVQAEGELRSPFALRSVEIEQLPRGLVELHGQRNGRPKTWRLAQGAWCPQSRPALPRDLLPLYKDGRRDIKAKRVERGIKRYRLAATRSEAAGDPTTAAWWMCKVARVSKAARDWAAMDAAFGEAVRLARAESDPIPLIRVLEEWGQSKQSHEDWAGAEEKLREQLAILKTAMPAAQMEYANSLSALSTTLAARNPGEADALRLRALEIFESINPESLNVAGLLSNAAWSAMNQNAFARTTELLEKSLAIRWKHGAEDAGLVWVLRHLAFATMRRGDFGAAERYAQQSIDAAQAVGRETEVYASALSIKGVIKYERGELATAEALIREALALKGRLGIADWGLLTYRGLIADKRGDPLQAESLFRQALQEAEKGKASIHAVGMALDNLGYSLMRLGRLGEAEMFLRRGLQVASGRDSESEAYLLGDLAILARTRGELDIAERHLLDAIAIRQRSFPAPIEVARLVTQLGRIAFDRGQNELAENRFRQALETLSRLMPGSHLEARALNDLGRAQRAAGRQNEAAETLCRAEESIDQQSGRLGEAQESRSAFAADYADYPRDCVAARVAIGHTQEAFRALERSRASVLLRMLAERHLTFTVDLPAEIASERSQVHAEYDRTQAALGKLGAEKDAAEVARLQARLLELRDQRAGLAARIRQSSPRLASLQYPEPLDLKGVRETLDPGTLFLAYSAGEKETLLFAVEPAGSDGPGLSVHAIPLSRAELSSTIEALRGAISRVPARPSSQPPSAARELYQTLLSPVEGAIARHQRLLISPDGPLHALPFAALWGGTPEGYLVERVPVHVVASATVYAELKKSRRATAPGDFRVVAFGDPKYPRLPKSEADGLRNYELRSAVLRGEVFPALPETRTEVENIAALFPGRTTTFLGGEAKEEKAKTVGKDARYLHFACHGVLNERFPLDSALALSLSKNPKPGQDNGLLQAWEVFDSVRLDAELVTLSACQSGLGKEMGGEGLLGLTRAFQYAGARSVLASLWSVGDESTAELMKRFYRHLRDGASKDEALRRAQREMIGRGAHPFHWAAFQLSGDWK